jgi:flagellar export protein FliJ
MIDGTDEEIKYQYKLLARLQKKADMKKKEVIAAHIDVSKFEKLKEKKLAEYRFAEQKENEAFIEEFVQNASARESGAGA